ncbi:MAG: class I SAM-dependent methyltransferase [Caldilineaceae bacterium]|nr:class I SAM-dependent methyltransferase [Caldilineaceae bacterium]
MNSQVKPDIPVIDYEGSNYQTDFWVGKGRDYEDQAERMVLDRLVPKKGTRVAEIGAGFGRLADLYLGYEQIILFDYSRTLLQEAVERWGADPRFIFAAGNIYQLPFADAALDTLVMVRVMHHLANVETALTQIRRVLHAESCAVLEYANKRNLKSLLRWYTGRQSWSPNSFDPVEFVELNFDFHPRWMDERFQTVGLHKEEQLAVSHFRMPLLKKTISPHLLVQFEQILVKPGGLFPLAPSVFVKVHAQQEVLPKRQDNRVNSHSVSDLTQLFRCPQCETESLTQESDSCLHCQNCHTRYLRKNKIWDFKNPQ